MTILVIATGIANLLLAVISPLGGAVGGLALVVVAFAGRRRFGRAWLVILSAGALAVLVGVVMLAASFDTSPGERCPPVGCGVEQTPIAHRRPCHATVA